MVDLAIESRPHAAMCIATAAWVVVRRCLVWLVGSGGPAFCYSKNSLWLGWCFSEIYQHLAAIPPVHDIYSDLLVLVVYPSRCWVLLF